jgi:WD repeat-containing protein 23
MSSPNAPSSPPADEEIPRTIVYDPNDPFWRDTEDDDDDMDFVPAEEGGSDEAEDEEGDLSFHGMYMSECICYCVFTNVHVRCSITTE